MPHLCPAQCDTTAELRQNGRSEEDLRLNRWFRPAVVVRLGAGWSRSSPHGTSVGPPRCVGCSSPSAAYICHAIRLLLNLLCICHSSTFWSRTRLFKRPESGCFCQANCESVSPQRLQGYLEL